MPINKEKALELLEQLDSSAHVESYKAVNDLKDAMLDKLEDLMELNIVTTKKLIKAAEDTATGDKSTPAAIGRVAKAVNQVEEAVNRVEEAVQGIPEQKEVTIPTVTFDPVVEAIESATTSLKKELAKSKSLKTEFPTSPKNPIAVRLSNGEDWIEQLVQVIGQSTGGGGVPKITVNGVQAIPVVNPDGTNIGGGTGGAGDASAANQTSQIALETSIKTAVETIDNAVSGAGFNITQFAGVNNATGSGTATGALRVELPTNGTGVIATVGAVTEITNALPAGTNNIGDVDVLSVPSDPFGANADAASATGSISAKLRGIATALGVTALDLGSGTGGSRTLRTFQDTAQWVGGTGTDSSAVQRVSLATNVSLPAGTNAIGKLAANSGVDIGDVDVTSLPALAAGTNLVGQVNLTPQTANGLSVFNGTSSDGGTALTNTAQAIKASAGQVYGWYIYNPNSSAQYVQLYNTAAASVTVGTTNPLFMLTIPATSAANVEFTNGITFSNAGFSAAATSTAGGNGAPSTALEAVIFYK